MLSGCITCSVSAFEMLNLCWLSVASSSPMGLFDAGARSSARALPTACAAVVHGPVTSGTLMVCHEHISDVGDVELYER